MSEFANGFSKEKLDVDFGDYVEIEQKRFGTENEWYQYKVIGQFRSNGWIDTPISYNSELSLHDSMDYVLNVVCCGLSETKVIRVRKCDCRVIKKEGD